MFDARKVLGLSVAIVLASAVTASAADLYGGLKDAPGMAPMPAPSAGWYARVDGGYNWYMNPSIEIDCGCVTGSSLGGAWSVGGGIGHYFGRGFRGDITVDHLFNADAEATVSGDNAQFDVSSTIVLANLYYDFNRGGRFVPYVGAGIGFAHNETSSGTVNCGCLTESIGDGSSNSFAAAAMAGVSWRIRGGQPMYAGGLKDESVVIGTSNALYLDVGYRFLYLGDVETGVVGATAEDLKVKELMAHEVRMGLRYDLN